MIFLLLLFILVLCLLCVLTLSFWYAKQETEVNPTGNREQASLEEQNTPITSSSMDYAEKDLVYSGEAPIYVTLFSHNEDSWESSVKTPGKYADYREGLINRAQLLAEYGIKWDWQTDQPVVEAMALYENDLAFLSLPEVTDLQGKNILQYLETLDVSFDPHVHTNNYADVVYVMENRLGVTPTGVIGGAAHVECGKTFLGFLDYVSWYQEIGLQSDGFIHGEDYPEARWKPEILSGAGMGGHWFDNNSTGIWKPGDKENFYSHFPENQIIYIGEGYPHNSVIIGEKHASGSSVFSEKGDYLIELMEKIENKELPTGTKDGKQFMYTASVHMRDKETVTEGENTVNTVEGLRDFLEAMQPFVDSGKIIFVNFEESAEIWQEEYQAVPWQVGLEVFSFYEDLKQEAENYCASQGSRRK
ncbi:MAG: hypothetical protein UU08_C0009G0030 [Candidatus Uhrbacteria bacterium GW2011_GWE2_40_58]|nr:MAG: hypothetical protein UT94_C0030G0006 [Candidatus Uhrbacteria bacterium GW2011_GWF2_40_263]KKR67768.1 MAG: hypothetical protein UU08_C0009G0030 [Candidatus Uhrbacteria bacterium GW2011_GWE2_40_58]OGL92208.1 MAG: hypothetical protein A2239_03070 [Candidatus Uhrbacteria bacterium RIFOXYA2_FULL_40_9]OGL96743.1 MAG: hypothetical protein A2332_00490 [Candidatus Uhrbacteria bacterium RIFOXYB2_FULL_41_18]HBK35284.1 hypothetical protein [Candidatus Uhrbacteria bacterium]